MPKRQRFELESFTVAQLKVKCKEQELPTGGRKEQLINRLCGIPEAKKKKHDNDNKCDHPTKKTLVLFHTLETLWVKKYTPKYEESEKPPFPFQNLYDYYDSTYYSTKPLDCDLLETYKAKIHNQTIFFTDNDEIPKYAVGIPLCEVKNPNWSRLWHPFLTYDTSFLVKLNVDINYLEFAIRNIPHEIPCRRYLTSQFRSVDRGRIETLEANLNEDRILFQTEIPECQPLGLSFELNNTQLNCVSWMKDVEQKGREISFSRFVKLSKKLPGTSSNILVDANISRFIIDTPENPAPVETTRVYGGVVLCPDGGKQELLALIRANTYSPSAPYTPSVCIDFTRWRTKATMIICSEEHLAEWTTLLKQCNITHICYGFEIHQEPVYYYDITVHEVILCHPSVLNEEGITSYDDLHVSYVGNCVSHHDVIEEEEEVPLNCFHWYRIISYDVPITIRVPLSDNHCKLPKGSTHVWYCKTSTEHNVQDEYLPFFDILRNRKTEPNQSTKAHKCINAFFKSVVYRIPLKDSQDQRVSLRQYKTIFMYETIIEKLVKKYNEISQSSDLCELHFPLLEQKILLQKKVEMRIEEITTELVAARKAVSKNTEQSVGQVEERKKILINYREIVSQLKNAISPDCYQPGSICGVCSSNIQILCPCEHILCYNCLSCNADDDIVQCGICSYSFPVYRGISNTKQPFEHFEKNNIISKYGTLIGTVIYYILQNENKIPKLVLVTDDTKKLNYILKEMEITNVLIISPEQLGILNLTKESHILALSPIENVALPHHTTKIVTIKLEYNENSCWCS